MAFGRLNLGSLGVDTFFDKRGLQKGAVDAKREISGLGRKLSASAKALGPVAAAGAAAVVTAMAGAAAAIGSVVTSFAEGADEMAKASKRIGVSVEEFQELKFAAGLAGAQMTDVETTFRRLGKNANDASMGIGIAKRGFEELDVSVTNADGTLRSQVDLFTEVADKISKTTNETKKVAFANDIFGRSGAKLLPLLNEGADGIEKMRKEAHELGVVIGTEAAAQAERFNDAMSKLKQSATGLKNVLGAALIPIFTAAAEMAVELTKQLIKTGDAQNFIKDAVVGAVKGLQGFVRGIINFAKPLSVVISGAQAFASVIGIVIDAIDIWRDAIITVGLTIGQFITGVLSGFIDGAADLAKMLGRDKLAGALDTFGRGVGNVADGIGKLRDLAVENITKNVEDLGDGAKNAVGALGDLADTPFADKIVAGGEAVIGILDGVADATLNSTDVMDTSGDKQKKKIKEIEMAWSSAAAVIDDEYIPALERASAGFAAALDERDAQAAMGAQDAANREAAASGRKGAGAASNAAAAQGMAQLAAASTGTAVAAAAATGGLSALASVMVDVVSKTEGFQRIMERLQQLFDNVVGLVIEGVMMDLFEVVKPITNILGTLAPILRIVLKVMNPFIFGLKAVAKLLEALSKPIRGVVAGLKKFVGGLAKGLKKIGEGIKKLFRKKNKDEDPIIIITTSANEAAEALDEVATAAKRESTVIRDRDALHARRAEMNRRHEAAILGEIEARRKMVQALNAFSETMFGRAIGHGSPVNPFGTDTRGSGLLFELGPNGQPRRSSRGQTNREARQAGFISNLDRLTGSLGDAAEAADTLSSSLLNVPEVFDANLARFNASFAGGSVSVPGGGSFQGGTQMFVNIERVVADSPEQLMRALERVGNLQHGTSGAANNAQRFFNTSIGSSF